jgi:hypothetical protein
MKDSTARLISAWCMATADERIEFVRQVGPAAVWDAIVPNLD